MTDRFAATAREVAAINGLPDYPFAVIEHPIAGAPDDELRGRAERALPSIISILTARRG